ncbi:hypothetical protein GO013_11320 [Pseudodesulfovibrio sp. JC047]|uniref:KAP family P-loop NTPase fold protein n=1 Tax=Pseudodesulfovibrio sp. JC047 TaxID=2683199 RepID=UPI0013D1117E|nr:P-loop NTPase fold protein [Pseudodesulfovibrio sp. JC047]NDV20012.1 hypothetical protein [Pseudodesulfovibrio sp. JC047]
MLLFPPLPKIKPMEGFTEDNDIFKRKPFGESLMRLVQRSDEAIVLGLEGPWGAGKTTFVQQWRGLLSREENGSIDSIYFDSFSQDYQDDPMAALADELYEFIDSKAKGEDKGVWVEQKPSFKESVGGLLTSGVGSFGKVCGAIVGAGVSAVSGGGGPEVEMIVAGAGAAGEEAGLLAENYFESRKLCRKGLKEFKDSLKAIGAGLREQKKSLVFIIDELDRCRPDFALDILEKVKHVFSVPGIVFVLVYNGKQLEQHIRARYGDVDAAIYLNKFININVLMPKAADVRQLYNDDTNRYVEYLVREMGIPFRAEGLIAAYAIRKGMSFREIGKIMTLISTAKLSLPNNMAEWDVVIFGVSLVFLCDQDLFKKLRDKENCWADVNSFFEFKKLTADELNYAKLEWFHHTWSGLLNPHPTNEERQRFGINGENTVALCCRALSNFTPNPA